MLSASTLTVDLSTIENNLQQYITRCGHVMVMVKANGYGTDPLTLSQFITTLESPKIPFLGVSHVSEGIELREAGITLPIFVISVPPEEAEEAVAYELTAAVSTVEEAMALNRHSMKQNKTTAVHLLLDTGMNRSGISIESAGGLYDVLTHSPHVSLDGVWTHFVAAESEKFDPFTLGQIRQFQQFLSKLPKMPKWIHVANSGGAVRFHLPFCNLARVGLGFVGYGPILPQMKCALTFESHLAAIKVARQGETVGYHCLHKVTEKECKVGVIPVGYFDGFPRSLSGKGYVFVHGKQAPMIGRVCMDFMMIDLSQIPEAHVGDRVVLFDNTLTLETVADWAQTDLREILVSIPKRVKRIWQYKSNLENYGNAKKLSNAIHPF